MSGMLTVVLPLMAGITLALAPWRRGDASLALGAGVVSALGAVLALVFC